MGTDLAAGNPQAKVLANALDKDVSTFLVANKTPGRKVKEIDNRGSHYWVARYWAEEMAKQTEEPSLQAIFQTAAKEMQDGEAKILQDMIDCQGQKVDIGGYYRVDKAKTDVDISLGLVHTVVATDVHFLTLAINHVLQNLSFAILHFFRCCLEDGLEGGLLCLLSHFFSPVTSNPVVAAAIIDLLDLSSWILVG